MSSSELLESNQIPLDTDLAKRDNLISIRDGSALFSVDLYSTQQESMEAKETERILCYKTSSKLISTRFMEEATISLKKFNNTRKIQAGSSIFTS
jgi:hypothetical protein